MDSESFEQAFAKLNAQVTEAFNLGDAKLCGEFYAEDATMFLTDHDPIHGRPAIESALQQFIESGAKLVPVEPVVIRSSAEMSVCAGPCEFEMPENDPTRRERGKFVTVFMRQPDGSWKAVVDSIMRDASLTRE